MTLTDYVEAAIIAEGVRNSDNVPQSFFSRGEILRRLAALLGGVVREDAIEEALDRLTASEIVDVIRDDVSGDFFRVDYTNLVKARNDRITDKSGLVYKYGAIGHQFLANAVRHFRNNEAEIERPALEQPEAHIPASDRIVRLDDNSAARDEIVGRLEELTTAVRGHNDEDGKLEDRERIVSELRAGQELLKAPSVRVRALWVVLGTALTFIATEFAGGVIGELASLLLETLKPLLGL